MGIQLPERASRGKRIQQALEEEEEADAQFWNQEFFAEEAQDIDYAESSESEDVPDTDFDESEGSEEDEEVEEVQERGKKKVLKPPGAVKRPRPAKPKSPQEVAAADEEDEEAEESVDAGDGADDEGKPKRVKASPTPVYYEAPSLRKSTMVRVADAELERQQRQAPRRKAAAPAPAPVLTQAELLAEAAYTELDNIASLKLLLAREEETKKRAMVVKKKYSGPSLRLRSRRMGEEELTTMEVRNAQKLPERLCFKPAPPPPVQPTCCITGLPAKYRDPMTGLFYATAAAFQQIRSSRGVAQLQHQPPAAQPAGGLSEDVVALVADFFQHRAAAL